MDAGKESDLQSFLERLEKASGGDREIDAALHALAYTRLPNIDLEVVREEYGGGVHWNVKHRTGGGVYRYDCAIPAVTSSLDAALSLVERVMPGWMVVNLSEWESPVQRKRGRWMAQLKPIGTQGDLRVESAFCLHAPTPALALCLALVRAKLEDEKGNDRE